MAKIAKIIFILSFVCFFLNGATNYFEQLEQFDKKIKIVSDDEILRIHHSLKNIYINAIVQNDALLKIEALQRLVTTAGILRLDSSGYSRELATLQKQFPSNKPPPKIAPKEVSRAKAPSIKKQVTYTTTLAKLRSITDKGEKLELVFDKKLSSKDIKSFGLKSRDNHREVFDIAAILPFSVTLKTPKTLQKIKIAQYNTKTLRLVLQRSREFKSKIAVSGDKINIYYTNKVSKKEQVATNIENILYMPSKKTIVLDPGHGGKDVGAVGSRTLYEKNLVLSLTLKIGKNLQKKGYRVFFTRTKDVFIKLRDRTKYANKKNADLFISVHANAADKKSLHGVETFFLSPDRSNRSKNVAALENKADIDEMNYFAKQTYLNFFNNKKIIAANKLALDVQQGMLNILKPKYKNIRDGGVREAPFWVLVGAQMPAILIEAGYISNTTERKRMFDPRYQDLLAKGIANGLDSYFAKNN